MSLTAIIVDDEPLLRAQLGESLQALWPQLNIVAEADHGEAALDVIATHHPDFVFLDIEMPGISGLDVAAEVHLIAKQTHIVFVTAYDQYAIDAFEQGAIDYLLKPASKARLAKTIARLQSLASRAQPQMDEVLASILPLMPGRRRCNGYTHHAARKQPSSQWKMSSIFNPTQSTRVLSCARVEVRQTMTNTSASGMTAAIVG
jgi:DNA-binding LytR/AlgR family response regulator